MSFTLLALALAAAPALLGDADLTPALSGPPAGAGALLEAGLPVEALAALGQASRPEARLVRALAQEAVGSGDAALASLAGLETQLPALADRIALIRGRLLAAAGRQAAAENALAQVPPGSPLAQAARLGRARALAALEQREAAREVLAPVLLEIAAGREPTLAGGALRLSGALLAAGPTPDLAGARQALLECWSAWPADAEAPGCLAALTALPGEAGRPPPPEAVVRRAEALIEQARAGEAVASLDPLVKTLPAAAAGEPLACRARVVLGRALKRERQPTRSAELLRPAVDRCADPALRERALFVLATAVQATGAREEAIALYLRFARTFPESSLADDALLNASDLAARQGRLAEARELVGLLVRDHPQGDQRDQARFRLGWLAWRAGDVEAALATFLAIEEESRGVDAFEHGRAAYWRARLLSERGEAGLAAARAIWTDLVTLGPADYYAALARARLAGEPGWSPPEPGPAEPLAARPLEAGVLAGQPAFDAGLAYLRAGLPHHAAEALAGVDRARLDGAGIGPTLCLAELLRRAGDHLSAHQLLRQQAREPLRRKPEGADRAVWEVAYPPAWSDLVQRHAPGAGVPPELLQALMREESALDPAAVSGAGAIGLTQLMLPTAQAWARRLAMPRPDRAGLTVPATSIRIGAAYLGALLKQFEGSPALALAAYNAGENAVLRWRAGAPRQPLDEFVEEIPYDETRGYVKRVLRSYAAYRLMAGGRTAARQAPAGGVAGAGG